MGEARYVRTDEVGQVLAAATIDAFAVIQLPSGEAAFLDSQTPVSSGAYTDKLRKRGQVAMTKAVGVQFVPGQEVYWDRSAGQLTYKKVNDRDFLAGTVCEDATGAASTALVELNRRQRFDIDIARDATLTDPIGTQGLNTMGVFRRGGAHKFILSTTNEAQKLDIRSVDGFDVAANPIVEFVFRVVNDGAGTTPDLNIGVANGTHATDADSITQACFVHLDGNNVNVNALSRDGTSTPVTSTDTTIDYVEGSALASRVHVLMDFRDPADVQVIVNGALVLGSTVFNVSSATGPLFLVAHLEKTAAADVYEIDVDALRCWFAEQ